jgi:hypothetical protein
MADANSGVGNSDSQSFGRLSVSEAALRLKLSYQQTQALVFRGKIEGGKDDSGWWVEAASLDRYMEAQGAA